MKCNIYVILICMTLFLGLVSAEGGFGITLKPHYYLDGKEIINYENSTYDRLSFDVVGKNQNIANRIINLKIVDVSDELIGKFTDDKEILISNQEKVLWESALVDTTKFENDNMLFFVGVKGENEVLKQEFYAEGQIDIKINNPSNSSIEKPINEYEDWAMSIGNWVWDGNWKGGLVMVLLLVLVLMGVWWRYKVGDKLERWRNKKNRK